MTADAFRTLLARLADGWTRRAYDEVAAHFAEQVQYADPTRYRLDGRAALLDFFRNDEGMEQRTTFHTVVFDEARQVGMAEYTYEGTHRYHGAVVVKVAGGLITHWREYQHVDPRTWEEFAGETRFP